MNHWTFSFFAVALIHYIFVLRKKTALICPNLPASSLSTNHQTERPLAWHCCQALLGIYQPVDKLEETFQSKCEPTAVGSNQHACRLLYLQQLRKLAYPTWMTLTWESKRGGRPKWRIQFNLAPSNNMTSALSKALEDNASRTFGLSRHQHFPSKTTNNLANEKEKIENN